MQTMHFVFTEQSVTFTYVLSWRKQNLYNNKFTNFKISYDITCKIPNDVLGFSMLSDRLPYAVSQMKQNICNNKFINMKICYYVTCKIENDVLGFSMLYVTFP